MKKSLILLGISLFLFLVCPWLTVLFAGMNGMAICLILFFIVNPLFFIVEGILCGFKIKQDWWLPVASAFVYLLSTWLLFAVGEVAFVIYAGLYLAVGAVAMFGTHFGKSISDARELL